MADAQAEPFHIAYARMRERLQEGAYPPGSRIAAVDIADELGLSTTPVREALSRLAGEGILEERRGQGYFVRPLSASDIGDLYRMSLACLLIALDPHRTSRGQALAPAAPEPADPVRGVEAVFRQWTDEAGSRTLISAARNLQIQLGPVRRLEPRLFDDLDQEAHLLLGADAGAARADRIALLRQFHGRRIRLADRFASLLEASAPPRKK